MTARVLMVVPKYPYPVAGGLEKQAHLLAKSLRALGVDVQVLSTRFAQGLKSDEIVEGVPVKRIGWSDSAFFRFLVISLDLTRQLWLSRKSYDVVHLHQPSPFSLYVIFVCKILRKPVLTKLPNVGHAGIPGLRKRILGALRLRILLASDGIVAMTSQSIEELAAVKYPMGRVLPVPNGVEINSPRAKPPKSDVEPCRVVFVGRVSEGKGLHVLLEAWSRIGDDAKAVLEIWGHGPLEPQLRRQCEELGLTDKVVWKGFVERVPAELPGMDVFVLPSRAEGNSNAVLEAMSAGLPIVSTPVGGTPLQVGEEGREYLCQVDDAAGLAAVLRTLIADPELRRSLGAKMRERAESMFSIDGVAAVYAKAYEVLASGGADNLMEAGSVLVQAESPPRRAA